MCCIKTILNKLTTKEKYFFNGLPLVSNIAEKSLLYSFRNHTLNLKSRYAPKQDVKTFFFLNDVKLWPTHPRLENSAFVSCLVSDCQPSIGYHQFSTFSSLLTTHPLQPTIQPFPSSIGVLFSLLYFVTAKPD